MPTTTTKTLVSLCLFLALLSYSTASSSSSRYVADGVGGNSSLLEAFSAAISELICSNKWVSYWKDTFPHAVPPPVFFSGSTDGNCTRLPYPTNPQDLLQDILQGKKRLRIGVQPYPPFFEMVSNSLTRTEEPTAVGGPEYRFGNALIDIIAQHYNQNISQVEWVNVPRDKDFFLDLLNGLVKGSYDVIISSLASTPSRTKVMQFSAPYFAEQTALLRTEKDRNTLHLSTLQDVNRKQVIIAVVPGTVAYTKLVPLLPNATFVEVTDWHSAITNNLAHVVPWDDGSLDYFLSHQGKEICRYCYLLPVSSKDLPQPTFNSVAALR
jgi:ABC-type amino acid transport substrate-binding protein